MNNAYEDNYWGDQGNRGVYGAQDAYGDAGNEPAWSKEEDDKPTPDNNDNYGGNNWQDEPDPVVKTESPPPDDTRKKSKGGKKSKESEDVTVEKKQCCNQRLKRYMGMWTLFFICMAVGVLLMATGLLPVGLIVFFVGLGGLVCSGWCFRKCGSRKNAKK